MTIQITINDDLSRFSDYVSVKDISSDGKVVKEEYLMTVDQLVSVLQRSEYSPANEPSIPVQSPILPDNGFKHVWREQGQTQDVYTFVPAQQYDIRVHDTFIENVGFPSMIFCYQLDDSKITNLRVVAVKEKDMSEISENTEIYRFPFSNVQRSEVCMGANPFPKIESVRELKTLHNFFITIPFTNEWFDANSNNSDVYDLRELFNSVQGQAFPTEWLSSEGITFNQFFRY
ncbi:hypothetical protein [Pontibacillus halophilus]|uniref:hypothetical protein n=1 Tax=Pontibacillus halophilus TaxID=516704 RepID=UPI00040F20F1|nr:hypothetical protein [Pontibacillus halophilus]